MGRDEIYILKHKDLDVAMVKINPFSGRIEYVLEVYMPEELPVGCAEEGSGLAQWWNMRAVPDTRKGIQQQLKLLGEETSQSLMDYLCQMAKAKERIIIGCSLFRRNYTGRT